MSRKATAFCIAGCIALLAGIGFYAALRGSPSFYHVALQQDPETAARASDAFLQRVAGVIGDVSRVGAWEAVIPADEINGWLAVDVPNNFPDLAPAGFQDPRISISAGDITFAGHDASSRLNTVMSISCDLYLSAPSVVAIRVKSMRAGLAPLPLGQALEAITHAAQAMGAPIEWRRDGGDPVALISIVPLDSNASQRRIASIDRIELRAGELAIAGHTGSPPPLSTATRLRPVETSEPLAPPKSEALQSDDSSPPLTPPAAENDTLQR